MKSKSKTRDPVTSPDEKTDYQQAAKSRKTGLEWFKKGNPQDARDSFAKCARASTECANMEVAMQGLMDIDNALKQPPAVQIKMYRSGIAAIQKALRTATAPDIRAELQKALAEASRDVAESEQLKADLAKANDRKGPRKSAMECVGEIKRWQIRSSYRILLNNSCDHLVHFKVTTCDSKPFGGQCRKEPFHLSGDGTDVIESFIQYPLVDLAN